MVLFPLGSAVRVEHRKPWSRTVWMDGVVSGWRDGLLTIQRQFVRPGGTYDTLGERILPGDHGTIEVLDGAWVLRRTYVRASGVLIGELFNIQTPVELSPGLVRYIDLEVDVARYADGRVEVVDESDLAKAITSGAIDPELAQKALAIAHHLAQTLRAHGDWRAAAFPSD